MAYFTKSSLRAYAGTRRLDQGVQRNLKRFAAVPRRIFLSHSHADLEDIENAKILLAAQSLDVYIDALDPAMPAQTSAQTAHIIRERIRECSKFVVLATNNAVSSKWVPWELGFADAAKTPSNVAILPLADNQGVWTGSEYFGLYPQIQTGYAGATVVTPGNFAASALMQWLR